jgi:branched-chain amino acid transport system substrate-binding protein
MGRRILPVAAGALVAAFILAASSQGKADDIQLAAIHATTGPLAFLGVPATNAMKVTMDQLNAEHFLGNDKLVLDVQDDGAITTQTMTLINRAALQLHALVILGPTDSIRSVAVAPLINDLKVPTITTAQSAAGLVAGPWLFKSTADPTGAISPLADYAAKKLNLKRVASVFLRDSDGQIANAKVFTDGVTKAGVPVVAQEGVLSSDTDYSAIATKLAGLDIDGIFIGANAVQAANIVLQLKRAGVRPDIKIFGSASFGVDYIKAGGAAVDGSFLTIDYNPQNDLPQNKTFYAEYLKRFSVPPDNWAGVGQACMMVAAYAIKAAGPNPTREKVRDAIAALKDVPVVDGNGRWSQTPSRVPEYGIVVATIQGGKIVAAP